MEANHRTEKVPRLRRGMRTVLLLLGALLAAAAADRLTSMNIIRAAALSDGQDAALPMDDVTEHHASWMERGAALLGFGPLAKRDNEPAISPSPGDSEDSLMGRQGGMLFLSSAPTFVFHTPFRIPSRGRVQPAKRNRKPTQKHLLKRQPRTMLVPPKESPKQRTSKQTRRLPRRHLQQTPMTMPMMMQEHQKLQRAQRTRRAPKAKRLLRPKQEAKRFRRR
jgi:hypothetical protein